MSFIKFSIITAVKVMAVALIFNAHVHSSGFANVFWETQWYQSGSPSNVRKWVFPATAERKLSYSISGTGWGMERNKRYFEDALNEIGVAANIRFERLEENAVEVRFRRAHIVIDIRQYTDEELRQASCHAAPHSMMNSHLVRVFVYASSQYAYRCAHHELMHAMGLFGHPMGDTVLTYFGARYDSLSDLDKHMLKVWNSPAISPGMSAFRATEVLNNTWIAEHVAAAEQAAAHTAHKTWWAGVFKEMDELAEGTGEPPRIVYRSGRLTTQGLADARLYMKGMLGVAYMEGYGTVKNPLRGFNLLWAGAQGGARGAAIALGRGLIAGRYAEVAVAAKASGQTLDIKAVCEWYKEGNAPALLLLTPAFRGQVVSSPACTGL